MNNSSQPGLYQSANGNASSTLRPRAGRLISYLDDEDTTDLRPEAAALSTSSSTPPRFPSRSESHSPRVTVNRSKSSDKSKHGRISIPHTRSPSDPPAGTSGGHPGSWDPWSSFQELASTLLRNDGPGPTKDKPPGSFKKPVWMKQDRSHGSTSRGQQWGPKYGSSADAVQEAIEERQAKVQAKKREALLLADASENRDSSGRYKRRDSDAAQSVATSTKSDEEALVYLHKVQKADTLAGVIIKYNCHPETFRKMNRFWPNDDIQTRKHVLVPVEGSTVRGRRVDSPYLTKDFIGPGSDNPTSPRETSDLTVNCKPGSLSSEALSLVRSLAEDVEFRHDSWVMLPNFKDPVEALRVPRRALGYFPRARRKSNVTLTDTSTAASTPKSSFDMLRHPPTHAALVSASLDASPVRWPGGPPPRLNSSGRQRASSATGGNNLFADALRGPGGVGTLRGLRTEASRPGPAEDPLNRQFAQYLPNLLPPSAAEDMPRTGFSLRPTPRATPRASSDSTRSTRSNSNASSSLGEVGGAIEGWVRKMAGVKRERGAAIDKMGDLIELETTSEGIMGVDSHNSAVNTPTIAIATPASASVTDEALLNERFPVRGRTRNAYNVSSAANSGKNKED